MEKLTIDYTRFKPVATLPAEDRMLVEKARLALETAYAPFSGFKVGAAVLMDDGEVFTSNNQESEVFPAGMCAERSLLYYVQANYSDRKVEAIAIASEPAEKECYPCGICRQVLFDAEKRQGAPIRVIMSGRHSATVVDSAKSLLPFTFEL